MRWFGLPLRVMTFLFLRFVIRRERAHVVRRVFAGRMANVDDIAAFVYCAPSEATRAAHLDLAGAMIRRYFAA
jgi:hypothetical protein